MRRPSMKHGSNLKLQLSLRLYANDVCFRLVSVEAAACRRRDGAVKQEDDISHNVTSVKGLYRGL